jgi:hypothetical protein
MGGYQPINEPADPIEPASKFTFIIWDNDATEKDNDSLVAFLEECLQEVNRRLGTFYNIDVVDEEVADAYHVECSHHVALFNKSGAVITVNNIPEGTVARCVECKKVMRFASNAKEVNDVLSAKHAATVIARLPG